MDRLHEMTDEEREALRSSGYRASEVWSLDLDDPIVLAAFQAELRLIAEADRREGMDAVLDAFNAALLADEPDYEW